MRRASCRIKPGDDANAHGEERRSTRSHNGVATILTGPLETARAGQLLRDRLAGHRVNGLAQQQTYDQADEAPAAADGRGLGQENGHHLARS